MAARTEIEIGLTAAIVSVEDDEPQILVAGERAGEPRAGLPFGPFDPLAAPHVRDRAARMGQGADRPFGRLRRAALHVR